MQYLAISALYIRSLNIRYDLISCILSVEHFVMNIFHLAMRQLGSFWWEGSIKTVPPEHFCWSMVGWLVRNLSPSRLPAQHLQFRHFCQRCDTGDTEDTAPYVSWASVMNAFQLASCQLINLRWENSIVVGHLSSFGDPWGDDQFASCLLSIPSPSPTIDCRKKIGMSD